MTTNSLGLTVSVSDSLARGNGHIADYNQELSGYSHVISAWLGYDTADITITVKKYQVEAWLNGLGRDVVVTGPDGETCFEGFVNEISIDYGTLAIVRGPLLGICNLDYVVYAPLDASVSPAIIGDRTITTGATNSASIAKYGTIERILSVGDVTQTDAEQIRDTYLANTAEPETGKTLSIGRPGNISLRLRLAGYGHWLTAYLYSNPGATGYITATERITDILNAEINSFFSTTRVLETNAILVPDLEQDYPTAINAVKEVVDLGDANDNRWLFGFYEKRIPHYYPSPTSYEYYYRIYDPFQRITLANGQEVQPWKIRPGKWLQITDFFSSAQDASNIYTDPRGVFIESVTYSAPTGLSIQHSKTSTLERKIAKLGMGSGI
jgi:hypothetical protein